MTPSNPRSSTASTRALSSPTSSRRNPERTVRPRGWSRRLYEALPLMIVGGVGLAITVVLYLAGTGAGLAGNGSVQPQLWVLSLAVAITGLVAGTVVMLAGGSPSKPRASGGSPPHRSTRIRSGTTTPALVEPPEASYPGPTPEEAPSLPTPSSEAEYSTTEGTTLTPSPTFSRPFASASHWDEDLGGSEEDTEDSGEIESAMPSPDATAEGASPDFVLHQIEEIESSLRRKARPPLSD